MFRLLVAQILVIIVAASTARGEQVQVRITAPTDGQQVSERPFVEGTVADPSADVWVVIHPMEISEYWVQPAITVKEDGRWKVQVYVGRPGTVDVGKHFEVRAFAQPTTKLKEGRRTEWPEAKWKSNAIEVIRK